MNENNTSDLEIGLGDYTEKLIKTILPKLAARKAGCKGCNKRKIWLNNFGAIFS
jgi:hypothetical protein